MNFLRNNKITGVQAPLASGGTDLASTYVDMDGFDDVTFLGHLGTAGSTDVCTLTIWESSSTSSTGSVTANTISSSAGESDKVICLEQYRPNARYVKTHVTRSAAVEYGGTIAIQSEARTVPVSTTGATLAATPVIGISST